MSIKTRIQSWLGVPHVGATSDPPSVWQTFSNTGGFNNSGIPVNATTAMRASAVLACVRVLAETLAQVPLLVYRRVGDNKERATDHPLYNLLHKQPNNQQTSFEWRRLIQGHTAYRGNGYSEIFWDGRYPGELVSLNPDKVRIEDEDGLIIRYLYRDDSGRDRIIRPDNMLHLTGLSSDGIGGINPIQAAAQSIGITLAADKYGATFYNNGASPVGVLTHPGSLSAIAKDRLRDELITKTSGDNANKPLVMEEGMKWEKMTLTQDEAQFLETRKFQVNDIARIFRVPPHMIGDLEKATFSNIEDQALEFVKYTMVSWFVMWEQRLTRSLIIDGDDSIFIEFLVDGLLRGDIKGRAEANQIQFMNGAVTVDEWRAMENRNPLPDGQGEKHYRQMNLQEIGEEVEPAEKVSPIETVPPGNPGRQATNAELFDSLLYDAASRIRSANRRALKRGNYDKGKIAEYANKTLEPFGLKYTEEVLGEYKTTDDIFQILKAQRNEI